MATTQNTLGLTLFTRARTALDTLRKDQRGAAFVEYVIVVGLIAIVCIVAFNQFGTAVQTKVNQQREAITTMGGGGTGGGN